MFRILTLQEAPNPIGDAHEISEIETQLVALADQWDAQISEVQFKWYYWLMPWKWGRTVSLFVVTDFLLKSLDVLINLVDEHVDLGPDKKATVLSAIERLYDYVIREAMPIFLRPFAGVVKNYIIYTVISVAIDWIVDKYRNGSWRDRIKPAEPAPTVEPAE